MARIRRPARAAATIAWVALFGLGLREAGRRWRTDPLVFVTLACLAGQLALHMVYGEETLLYAMHWLPLLILVAGFALLGPARPWALALAIVTLVSGSANNLLRLDSIARMFRTPRQDVQDQMARRPGDPWAGMASRHPLDTGVGRRREGVSGAGRVVRPPSRQLRDRSVGQGLGRLVAHDLGRHPTERASPALRTGSTRRRRS